MSDDDLKTILKELENDETLSSLNETTSADKLDINDETVNDYILQKVGTLIENGIQTVESIQQVIASGFEPEELQAFSGLISSITNAADTLNRINIQNKKSKTAKELKQMDIDNKTKLPEGRGGNTNVLIATREEVIERFLEKNKKYINAEATEATDITEDIEEEKEEQPSENE